MKAPKRLQDHFDVYFDKLEMWLERWFISIPFDFLHFPSFSSRTNFHKKWIDIFRQLTLRNGIIVSIVSAESRFKCSTEQN